MSIAGIVLAAGASRRLGRPKQLVELAGETLVARALRIANQAELSPVIAVIAGRALAPFVEGAHAEIVWNTHAAEGMASSIRAGVSRAMRAGVSGAVLLTCDQIALTAQHLRALCAETDSPAGSRYAGRVGIPAYFPASSFASLLQLHGNTGARHLLLSARTVQNESLATDLDTPDDLKMARSIIGKE